jgi:CRP/FNR family transcriptional regulator, cyclic AMP receptor protein
MPYRFRVVPKKKRRRVQQARIGIAGHDVGFGESRKASPLIEERLFHNLPRHMQAGLDAISSIATFAKRDVLFVEGQKPLGVFVLRSGRVKLSASSADGKLLIVGRARPGEVLGLPTAISGTPNELTAEAIHPLQCDFIARDALLQFLREHGDAALRVAQILSEMYDAAFNQVRYLGLSASATEKLARFLLELPDAESQNNGHAKTLSPTHKEIAEMIGASRETVTRLFTRFKREQLVQVYDARLHIDRAGLEQLLVV